MHKRKFIIRVIQAIAALFSINVVKAGSGKEDSGKEENTKRVKMLTQDGELVWVELKPSQKSKPNAPISNKQLFSWIKHHHNE